MTPLAHPPTPSVSSYLPPLLYDSKRFWHQTGRKQLLKQEHSLFQTTKRLFFTINDHKDANLTHHKNIVIMISCNFSYYCPKKVAVDYFMWCGPNGDIPWCHINYRMVSANKFSLSQSLRWPTKQNIFIYS